MKHVRTLMEIVGIVLLGAGIGALITGGNTSNTALQIIGLFMLFCSLQPILEVRLGGIEQRIRKLEGTPEDDFLRAGKRTLLVCVLAVVVAVAVVVLRMR